MAHDNSRAPSTGEYGRGPSRHAGSLVIAATKVTESRLAQSVTATTLKLMVFAEASVSTPLFATPPSSRTLNVNVA